MSNRYQELLDCFRKPYVPGEPRCRVMDSESFWEGERWTETHPNGDSMTLGGMTVPLHTQFLVCKEHEPAL